MSTLSPAAATAVALDATERHAWFTALVTTIQETPRATVDHAESGDKAATFAEYGVPSPGEPAVNEYPELGVGDSNDRVACTERVLTQAGYRR
jgi:hypothetical protein